jgi:hypothetical protein
MIEPLAKDEPYPGRLPPLRRQWRRVRPRVRYAVVGIPAVIVAILFAVDVTIGVVALVLAAGVWAATGVYVKNRTDRHNAAVDRGEIRVPADPHLRRVPAASLAEAVQQRLLRLGYPVAEVGEVDRFDLGWIVKRRDRRAVGVVVGDDGEFARFDPTRVDELRAATEYRAGRGRDRAQA